MPICRTTTLIPFLLIFTIVITVWMFMGETRPPPLAASSHFKYSTVSGFFAQSDPTTDDKTFDFMAENFGLIEKPYNTDSDLPATSSQWARFAHKLATLNARSPVEVEYRLLFLGRHGQGYHNVAEAHFGTEMWDCYYSTLDGTANMSWADAHLTPLGVKQAEDVAAFWKREMEKGMPMVQSWYVSPLDRALRTAEITFEKLLAGRKESFKPVVKEMIREGIGIHTCDRRSSLSYIRTTYPHYLVESEFSETDPLWVPDLREPGSAQTIRLRGLLDDVFGSDRSTWISVTSHGGTIQSILRVVGHRAFGLGTGGVLPVLVKVERRDGLRPKERVVEWERKPECVGGDPGVREVEESLEVLDGRMKL
jgi:broad specificity phosphatase PhoE